MRPLCFVLMPFGRKPDGSGGEIDFDAVYSQILQPGIDAAGLDPLRADEEQAGGIIHKPMFERLVLCEYAVADLTAANANVFYELGVRHAVKPATTVLVFALGRGRLPFDVAPLRALPYVLGPDGRPCEGDRDRDALAVRLRAARDRPIDSPVFELLDGFPDIQHLKTDVFRSQVQYAEDAKRRLSEARKAKEASAIRSVEDSLGDLRMIEAGVAVDVFLSYRSVKAWDDMVRVVTRMSRPVAASVLVREQLAFALNRSGRGDEAEGELLKLIAERGPSSETYGLLGRVYKDRWEAAAQAGDAARARAWLDKAIEAYVRGFESDWRDAYPGVNAVTLMEVREPPDPRREHLIPVVAFAVDRRIAAGKPDYWDYATRLELAVLAKNEDGIREAQGQTLIAVREPWEAETTARNLRLILEARSRRGEAAAGADCAEQALRQAAGG